MTEVAVEDWLQEGIAAIKDGQPEKARLLFLKVVDADEDNESGWLWLSQVVDNEADKRTCLENVLTLNPENAAARRILVDLDGGQTLATSTAVAPSASPKIEYRQEEQFDDVWSRNVPICGYCAAPITPEELRCPACHRSLIVQLYRYPNPSSNLTLYWFMLTAVAVTYGAQVGYSAVTLENPILTTITGLFMMVLLLATAVFLYFRQYWANIFAIILLIVIMLVGIAQLLIRPDLTGVSFNSLDQALQSVVEPLTFGTWKIIKGAQVATAALALLFALRAAPDFDRVRYRQEATVTKGLRHASEFHGAAQRMAKAGLWATAVLNWQRAVALEPTRVTYQRYLGDAYARLGFYDRSLDVLSVAQRLTTHPETKAEINRLIQTVKQQAAGQHPAAVSPKGSV